MKTRLYLKRTLLLCLCVSLLSLALCMPCAAAEPVALSVYYGMAAQLAAKLDTQAANPFRLYDFNALYAAGNYTGAYQLYQEHMDEMQLSCWGMNNVGLAMLQLEKNVEALVLYMAIQLKARNQQPESLINLLVAGQALGFDPKQLLDAVGVSASAFKKSLQQKKYPKSTIDDLTRAMCCNVIAMKIEDPSVTAKASKSTSKPDLAALLNPKAAGAKMMAMLRTISKNDKVAMELLTYAEALFALRGAQAGK